MKSIKISRALNTTVDQVFNIISLIVFTLVIGCTSPTGSGDPVVPELPDLEQQDVTIGWISRLPEIDYVPISANPAEDGWPEPGQDITWRAHIKNWNSDEIEGIKFEWILNGNIVEEGNLTLPAQEYTTVDFNRLWDFERHELKFKLLWKNTGQNMERSLPVFTDALSVAFYVEEPVYDYFREHQHKINKDSYSFEDWAQRQMSRMNQLFEEAVYPMAPNGVLDRVRLQQITVVPQDGLPLNGAGHPVDLPDLDNTAVDLQWGFPEIYISLVRPYVEQLGPQAGLWGLFDIFGSLYHELGHARFLLDVYQYNVRHIPTLNFEIRIRENGQSIVNTPLMPATPGRFNREEGFTVFSTPEQGLMNTDYDFVDRYSAVVMNLIKGYRTVTDPLLKDHPEYIRDLPAENRITVIDQHGDPVGDAVLSIYQPESASYGGYAYPRVYDDIPDLEFQTDGNGAALVGENPFTGSQARAYTIILRAEKDGQVGYGFLEHFRFNLEYWRGNTARGEYTVEVTMLDPDDVL